MTFEIHQFLPTWEQGAIGTHAFALHEMCNEAGIRCSTWASEVRAGLGDVAGLASDYLADPAPRPNSVLLYHVAVGAELGDQLMLRPEPLVLDYHNLTPPRFFDGWHPALAENLEVGLAQVKKLASRCVLGIADSSFNASDLQLFGCARTAVAPVFMDLHKPVARELELQLQLERNSGRGTTWLFVGRIAPNKAQHEIVRAFAWYRQAYEPDAQLWLVGAGPADAYKAALVRLIERLELTHAVRIVGSVREPDLGAYYAAADVYVSLSQHEGFGVPLVEAMAAHLPVVAFGAAAVTETVGGAAVVIDSCDPALVAGCVARVMRDEDLRTQLIVEGVRRASCFSRQATTDRWLDVLHQLATIVH